MKLFSWFSPKAIAANGRPLEDIYERKTEIMIENAANELQLLLGEGVIRPAGMEDYLSFIDEWRASKYFFSGSIRIVDCVRLSNLYVINDNRFAMLKTKGWYGSSQKTFIVPAGLNIDGRIRDHCEYLFIDDPKIDSTIQLTAEIAKRYMD